MVVTFFPATALTGVTHERIGSPSMCTVQAPHNAMPQPYLVPVSPSESRSTQSRGVSGSTSACMSLPLMLTVIMCFRLPLASLRDWLRDYKPSAPDGAHP